ncbi:serine hydrolase domain-containing protein [Neolewinella agarilytica]|uniref:CubicO group peptidase, beta-lactamase class C family n=1 Tax=Neolewinella agarilytica TaxID=478744 RepID=A0A1H9M0U5_9BACT|nr:serine hydrolase [Neolewinella agarilytica]SER17304.1 CubicO group peptidase, beta-lactamase class C family [Neolewinella agarilytica]
MHFSPRLRYFIIGVTLLATLLFAAFLWLRPLLNIGGGYAAKHACSCHFLQGRELAEISEHDLNFSVLGFYGLEAKGNSVYSSFFGLVRREARFREGVGCTLVNNEEKPLAKVVAAAAGAKKASPESIVAELPTLASALDFGMQPVPGGEARGLVVMQNGRIIGERYAEGYDENSLLLGWSMTKTLTALLTGGRRPPALLENGTVDTSLQHLVSRKNLYPHWSADARANISLADLLHMNSGLGWNEAYGSISDATIMLHEHADMAAFAAGMPALKAPEDEWAYSSGSTNILMDLHQRQLPEGQSIQQEIHDLFGQVAPSLIIEPDQSGRPVGSSYGWATGRDWARLGQFMLQGGVWNGDTLLYPGWIDWMRQPAAGSEGTYGGQLWLPGPDMPSLPKDAFLMRGFQDQRVFIIPSRQLIIARLGHGEDKVTDFDSLVKLILESVPSGQ